MRALFKATPVLSFLLWVSAPMLAQEAPDPHAHHHPQPTVDPTPGNRATRETEMATTTPKRVLTPAEELVKARFRDEFLLKPQQRPYLFATYLETLGTQGILDVLEERNQYCHSEAHELGRAVHKHFQDLAKSLSECGSRCTSACMHGVLKEAFGDGSPEQVKGQLRTVCTEGVVSTLERPGNCAHGMGHALMMAFDNNVEQAIDSCSGFSDDALAYYCVTGVYMELFDRTPGPDAAGKSNCERHPRFPAACYRYQAPRLFETLGRDLAKLTEACRALPDRRRAGCFHGLGFSQLDAVVRDPARLAVACPSEPPADQTLCLEGLVEPLASFNLELAKAACAGLEGTASDICTGALAGMYRLGKPSLPLYLELN